MLLLLAMKAVLMLCKTIVWCLASNIEEVYEAQRCVHRNSKNQSGCARCQDQINAYKFPDFLSTKWFCSVRFAQDNSLNLNLPQMNVYFSFNYVYFLPGGPCFCSCKSSISLISLKISRPAQLKIDLV